MSEHSLDDFDRRVLRIVIENPRLHAYDISKKLVVEWIGDSRLRGWLWILLAPGSGQLYPSLAKLERFDLIKSDWGEPTKSGNRHRLYWSSRTSEPR